MTEQQRAALRILEATPPERIRTHTRREVIVRAMGTGRGTKLTSELIQRYVELREAGAKYMDIRVELPASSDLMRKLKERTGR